MSRTVRPGDRFRLVRENDRYRSLYYASASGDFNPIHVDPEMGTLAGLGGTILHGLCTLSWAVDAFGRFLGDPTLVTGIQVRFSRPVALEDTVTFEGTVTEVMGDRVVATLEARNQRGEDVLKNVTLQGRLAAP